MRVYLTILFFFILSKGFSTTYFFDAVTGDDTRSAAAAQNQATPWKSLQKLVSFWSSLQAGDFALFEGGQTFQVPVGGIVPTKGGTSAASITIGSYGTGKAIFSGFTTVPAWTSLGGNKWTSTGAVSTLSTCWMVLVNGSYAVVSQFPNGVNQYNTITSTNGTTTITSATLAGVNWTGGTVVERKQHWIIDRSTISSQSGNTITFPAQSAYAVQASWGFRIINDSLAADQQNEWWYNGSSHHLGIFSTTTPSNVELATVDVIIPLTTFNFISISNIVFRGSNTAIMTMTSANNHITFTNCDFLFHGTNGVTMTPAANNFTFTGCTSNFVNNDIVNCAAGANVLITNCNFQNTGQISGMGLSGDGQYTAIYNLGDNGTVTHSVFKKTGYSAIDCRGNANSITFNFIDTVCNVKDDGAGIYFDLGGSAKTFTQRTVDHNFVFNAGGADAGTTTTNWDAHGIYMDDNTSNVTISNNVVYHCGGSGIFLHASNLINVQNNLLYENASRNSAAIEYGQMFEKYPGAVSTNPVRNLIITGNKFISKANNEFVGSYETNETNMVNWPVAPASTNFNNNFYCRPVAENATTMHIVRSSGTVNSTLATWVTNSGGNLDANSKISPKTIPDTTSNNIRFFYDSSSTAKTFSIPGTWEDVTPTSFPGSITLQPFTGAVLLFVSNSGSPLSATAVATVNPLTCFGQTTSAQINATGGVAPYTYSINGGSFGSNNIFSNLGAATYTFQVKDAANTVVTVQLTITAPPQITITESNPPITINGNLTTITINANGGNTGTYTYSLDGVNFQPSNVFPNKGAGNYTATVKDSKGCINTLAFTITQPTAVTLSLGAAANPLNCNGDSTILTATVGGGTQPYTFRLNGGTPQAGNTFKVPAGTWQVTVTDAAGAVVTQTITITAPPPLTVSQSHTPITITGNGSTVTASSGGGSGSVTYSLDGSPFQSSPTFNNVLAGTHTLTAKDAHGCLSQIQFTITQPTNLIVSANITHQVSCNGGSDGQITGNAAGGTIPYDYQLNGGTRQSSPVFNNLTPGTYTLTVHDGSGAIVSAAPVTLTQPPIINFSLAYTSAPTNVTFTVNSGGVAPFTYSLDGVSQSNPTFTSIGSGNHTGIVTDANGCTAQQVFSIGSTLSISLSVGVIACNNGVTNATVTPNGGTFPYTYSWSNGQVQSTATNLSAGSYSVRVTDNAGHTHDTSFVIPQPAAINFSLSIGTILTHGGTAPVTATVNSGGVSPFTYSLDSASFVGSGTFPTVSAGNHFIIVKDNNGCAQRQDFTMSQPGELVITISRGSAPLCWNGTQNITVGSTGGTPPIIGTGTFNDSAGVHNHSIHDQFSVADTQIVVTAPPPLTLSVSFNPIVVNGNLTTITGSGGGGTGTLNYSLDGVTYQASPVFTNKPAGVYRMYVKDANGCITTNDFSIPQPDPLTMTATPTTNPLLCANDVTTTTLAGFGGTQPFTYGKNGVFGGSNTFSNLSPGTYTFSVKDAFNARHDTIIIISAPLLISLVQVSQTTITNYGGTADVTIQVAGGTPITDSLYNFAIDGGGYTLGTNAFSFTFTSVTGGNHTVSIKDANNCVQTYSFFVVQPAAPLQYWIKSVPRIKHIYVQL